MKIRVGFVSNSSSSSFIVAWKGNLKEEIEKAFKFDLPENYPVKNHIFKNIAAAVFSNIDNIDGMEIDELMNDYGY